MLSTLAPLLSCKLEVNRRQPIVTSSTAQRHNQAHRLASPTTASVHSRSALSSWLSPFVVPAPSLRSRGRPLQHPHHLSCRTFTPRSETPSCPPSRVTVPLPPLSSLAFFLSPFSSPSTSFRICPSLTRTFSCAPILRRK